MVAIGIIVNYMLKTRFISCSIYECKNYLDETLLNKFVHVL